RPNADALGISQDEARALAHQIETGWTAWAANPTECDAVGRHNLHQLATAGFKSWLLTGETLFALDWQTAKGATTRTKVNMLDVRQLDQT
ncbi:phage portal protein, partial [Sphingobacterium sp. NPDC055431]